jgi:hypothetical protein
VRSIAVCAIALAVVTGCDSPLSGSADKASSTATTSQELEQLGVFPLSEVALERGPKPVRKLYGVFRRRQSRREVELRPQMAVDAVCSNAAVPHAARLGETNSRLGRILLSDLGPMHDVLVAVPTTTDYVTVAISGRGGGCGVPLTRDGLMLGSQMHDTVATVYGMVGDEVASVDLVVDGKREHAELGENGFALEIPDAPGKNLEGIVLEHHDGSVTKFPPTE